MAPPVNNVPAAPVAGVATAGVKTGAEVEAAAVPPGCSTPFAVGRTAPGFGWTTGVGVATSAGSGTGAAAPSLDGGGVIRAPVGTLAGAGGPPRPADASAAVDEFVSGRTGTAGPLVAAAPVAGVACWSV